MNSMAIPFPRPQGYCKRKQCTCEYANMFGCCVYTYCLKRIDEKVEYLTHTILKGTENE